MRLLPGAMSDHDSAFTDSFWERGLSAPSYTRPPEYRGHVVPDILPLVGYSDDAAALVTALRMVAGHIRPEHREAARRALAGGLDDAR